MEEIIKKLGFTAIIQDVLLIIFGIILMTIKGFFLNTFVLVVGGFCILKGVVDICKYIIAKGVSEFYKDDLIFGIMALVLGISFILFKDSILWMLRLSIGLYVVLSALKNIYLAIKVKKCDLKEWIPMFVISVVMLVIGIVIIVKKGAIINLCAMVMIAYAVLDIINNVILLIKAKEIFKELKA